MGIDDHRLSPDQPSHGAQAHSEVPPAVASPGDVLPGRVTPGRASKPRARTLGAVPVALAFVGLMLGVLSAQQTYEQVQSGQGAAGFDQPLQDWMVAHRQPWLDALATWFTNLGGKIGMTILATTTVLALARWWRTWTPVVVMLVATAGSLTMTTLGKELTARARPPFDQAVPPLESSASFPSGHTLNAVLITSIIGYLVLLYVTSLLGRVLTGVGLALFAALMGTSRVYLGHHWLTDVLAGAAVGAGWALAVVLGHWLYVRLRTKDRAPSVREVAQDHRERHPG